MSGRFQANAEPVDDLDQPRNKALPSTDLGLEPHLRLARPQNFSAGCGYQSEESRLKSLVGNYLPRGFSVNLVFLRS